ncbi:hypothetical protein ES707_07325 [subsurface metagenome]
MNAKKVIILLLIAGVATAGVFASGNKEDKSDVARPDWRRMPRGETPDFSEETVTVTGELYFENRMHPELKSGSKEYELLAPRFYAYDLDLKDGQTVTVEGYTVEGMPCCEEEEEGEVHIWVTKAIIDGKEYDLEADGFRGGHMGSRRGMGMMGPGRRPYGDGDSRDWGRRW